MHELFSAHLELAKKQVALLEALEKRWKLPDFTNPEELVMLWTMHSKRPIDTSKKPLTHN